MGERGGSLELVKYEGLPIGAAAPDFSLPAVDGKTYSLASFQDKPVLRRILVQSLSLRASVGRTHDRRPARLRGKRRAVRDDQRERRRELSGRRFPEHGRTLEAERLQLPVPTR